MDNAEYQLTMLNISFKVSSGLYIINPKDKPENMLWPKWQFALKQAAAYNQNHSCVCGDKLRWNGELHHALFSRRDVQGNKNCKNLIHHSYNVIVLCQPCHLSITRQESAKYLHRLYGSPVGTWYNKFPMTVKKSKFSYYLEETTNG